MPAEGIDSTLAKYRLTLTFCFRVVVGHVDLKGKMEEIVLN